MAREEISWVILGAGFVHGSYFIKNTYKYSLESWSLLLKKGATID
jgi:hypothetical protein